MKMNTEELTTKILENWPLKNVDYETALKIVQIAETQKTFGFKFTDKIEDEFKVSYGFVKLVIDTIKEQRKLQTSSISREDARADRILRIRDSNGKATARKWN